MEASSSAIQPMRLPQNPSFHHLRLSCSRIVLMPAVLTIVACHRRPEAPAVMIPAGTFLFTATEPLCRDVQRPGYTFTAPIARVDPLTGAIDPAIPGGTLGVFEIDHFLREGLTPMVFLRVRELIIQGRHVAVSGALANSNPEAIAALPNEPVCVTPGSRFLGNLSEDVKAK